MQQIQQNIGNVHMNLWFSNNPYAGCDLSQALFDMKKS
jgi:hypothetical protein